MIYKVRIKNKIGEILKVCYNRVSLLSVEGISLFQGYGIFRTILFYSLFAYGLFIPLAKKGHAQNSFQPTSDWEIVKEANRVQLMSRWILIGDSLKTRQLRLVTTIKADVSDILYCLRSEQELSKWKESARKFQVLGDKQKQWIFYTEFAIPRLLPQQDLILKYQVNEQEEKTLIDAFSIPDYMDRVPGVRRQEKYEEHWEIRPIDGQDVQVDFSSIAPSKPLLPRYLQDKFIHSMLINSFAKLKSQAEQRSVERTKAKNKLKGMHPSAHLLQQM